MNIKDLKYNAIYEDEYAPIRYKGMRNNCLYTFRVLKITDGGNIRPVRDKQGKAVYFYLTKWEVQRLK